MDESDTPEKLRDDALTYGISSTAFAIIGLGMVVAGILLLRFRWSMHLEGRIVPEGSMIATGIAIAAISSVAAYRLLYTAFTGRILPPLPFFRERE